MAVQGSTSRTRWSRRRLFAAGAGTALVLTLVAVILSAGKATSARPVPRNVVQGPRFAPATVTTAAGATITCPMGSVPYVNISNAYFVPKLRAGTSFADGTYHIELSGAVVNETTAPITITGLLPMAADRAWRGATVSAPIRLGANSSGALVIRGQYRSAGLAQAKVAARVSWHWSDRRLLPCGSKGLIDDD
jgi:hypothetical protein